MRQYIINQMHKRIMNADETANLEYPVWKRRTVVVVGFAALRVWSAATIAFIPVYLGLGIALYTTEAIKKLAIEFYEYLIDTFGANYRNLLEDIRGSKDIWKGEYGRGKLLPERPEMRIKNPTAKPTPLED